MIQGHVEATCQAVPPPQGPRLPPQILDRHTCCSPQPSGSCLCSCFSFSHPQFPLQNQQMAALPPLLQPRWLVPQLAGVGLPKGVPQTQVCDHHQCPGLSEP